MIGLQMKQVEKNNLCDAPGIGDMTTRSSSKTIIIVKKSNSESIVIDNANGAGEGEAVIFSTSLSYTKAMRIPTTSMSNRQSCSPRYWEP